MCGVNRLQGRPPRLDGAAFTRLTVNTQHPARQHKSNDHHAPRYRLRNGGHIDRIDGKRQDGRRITWVRPADDLDDSAANQASEN